MSQETHCDRCRELVAGSGPISCADLNATDKFKGDLCSPCLLSFKEWLKSSKKEAAL